MRRVATTTTTTTDDWRTSTTQRTPKRRAVSTASFYETADGRNLGAEYKKIDEARLVDTRKRQEKGAYRIFRKQAWLLEHADVMNGHTPGPLTNDDAADALERRLDARSDLEFYGVPTVQNPGRLWSEEVGGEGQRRHVYAHLNAFRESMRGCLQERRHFYELIREGAPVRPYFDLEFARDDASINGDDLTRRWLAVFAGRWRRPSTRLLRYLSPIATPRCATGCMMRAPTSTSSSASNWTACPWTRRCARRRRRPKLPGTEPDAAKAAVYDHVAAVARRGAATEPFCAISVKDHVLQLDASTPSQVLAPRDVLPARRRGVCGCGGVRKFRAARPRVHQRYFCDKWRVLRGRVGLLAEPVLPAVRQFQEDEARPLVVVGDGRLASEEALPEARARRARRGAVALAGRA